MLNVSFFLRKHKAQPKTGLGIVYAKICINGVAAAVSTKEIECFPNNWKETHAIGENSKEINRQMKAVETTLTTIHKGLEVNFPEKITALFVCQIFNGKANLNKLLNPEIVKEKTITAILLEMIEKNYLKGEITLKSQTTYGGRIDKIKQYFTSIGNESISYTEIDFGICENLILFLKNTSFKNHVTTTPKPKKNTYIKKYLQLVTAGHKYAFQKKHTKSAFCGFEKLKNDADKTIFLLWDELQKMANYDFSDCSEYDKVRDVFVFTCLTGFLWCDLLLFSKECLDVDEDGTKWLVKPREKTDVEQVIPFSVEAEKILLKYDWKLPLGVEGTHNKTIKIIAKLVGIKKILTNRCGRKTAGMHWGNSGYSLEEVAQMLGHDDIKTTSTHYTTILRSSLKETTIRIRGKK